MNDRGKRVGREKGVSGAREWGWERGMSECGEKEG